MGYRDDFVLCGLMELEHVTQRERVLFYGIALWIILVDFGTESGERPARKCSGDGRLLRN